MGIDQVIALNRIIFTNRSTIGVILIKNVFECYTLELSARKQVDVKNCILVGKYEIRMRWSPRFRMHLPGLLNVPGRTDVEIHPGNKPEDTNGCILPGQNHKLDWVGSSKAAYNKLVPKLENILKEGPLFINITGNV